MSQRQAPVTRIGTLCGMDEATVRAMLEQHFTSSDPDRAHEIYHEDAVLEFPQSAERFDGVENLREWRKQLSGVHDRRVPGDQRPG